MGTGVTLKQANKQWSQLFPGDGLNNKMVITGKQSMIEIHLIK